MRNVSFIALASHLMVLINLENAGIHDVLSELISTATQTDKPSIPEDLLASTKEKLEYLCKLAKEVPTLMKSCFDHSDFMDKYGKLPCLG